jgi:Heterokaryon incompatibility protein (HET)
MTPQHPLPEPTVSGDSTRRALIDPVPWSYLCSRYPLTYLVVNSIASQMRRLGFVNQASIRKQLLTMILLWVHHRRLLRYRPHFHSRFVTPLTRWENISVDLEVILLDSSFFWGIEVCRWIYSNLWYSMYTALQLALCLFAAAFVSGSFNEETKKRLSLLCVQVDAQCSGYRDKILTKAVSLTQSAILDRTRRAKEAELAKKPDYYVHRSLSGQIRLLKLYRTSLLGDIRCELHHYCLDHAPAYEAISYRWGCDELSHNIFISDSPYRVTANAEIALRSVQSMLRPRLIWIDSICINQTDNNEKEEQIMLMREIFRRAKRVIISLGDAEDTPLACQLLQRLSHAAQLHALQEIADGNRGYVETVSWRALGHLIKNPYFGRMWMIPEVAVASSIQVHFGSWIMDWSDVQIAFLLGGAVFFTLHLTTASNPFQMFSRAQEGFEPHSVKAMQLIRRNEQNGTPLSLCALLELSMAFDASKAHDYVFALQGLCAERLSSRGPAYDKSIERVYTEVARDILSATETSGLSLLSLAGIGHGRTMRSLPSWVPEWCCGERGSTLTNTGIIRERTENDYQASGSTSQRVKIDQELNVVSLRGLHVDAIRSINGEHPPFLSIVQPDGSTKDQSSMVMYRWRAAAWQIAQRDTPPISSTGESRRETFWRTSIGDRLLTMKKVHRPAPSVYGQYSQAYESFHSNQEKTSNTLTPWSLTAADFLSKNSNPSNSLHKLAQEGGLYAAACGPHSLTRSFCCTEKGHMGLIPPESRIGDLVCIIFGAQTPFILRRAETKDEGGGDESPSYRLVGECYIHAMMDGEMISLKADTQLFRMI